MKVKELQELYSQANYIFQSLAVEQAYEKGKLEELARRVGFVQIKETRELVRRLANTLGHFIYKGYPGHSTVDPAKVPDKRPYFSNPQDTCPFCGDSSIERELWSEEEQGCTCQICMRYWVEKTAVAAKG